MFDEQAMLLAVGDVVSYGGMLGAVTANSYDGGLAVGWFSATDVSKKPAERQILSTSLFRYGGGGIGALTLHLRAVVVKEGDTPQPGTGEAP